MKRKLCFYGFGPPCNDACCMTSAQSNRRSSTEAGWGVSHLTFAAPPEEPAAYKSEPQRSIPPFTKKAVATPCSLDDNHDLHADAHIIESGAIQSGAVSVQTHRPRHTNCTGNHRQLCDNGECPACFEKSFAALPDKAKLAAWSVARNGGRRPRDDFLNCNQKRWFTCPKESCAHPFSTCLRNVTTLGRWCPYCTNQRLCEMEDCRTCYKKSFASFPDTTKLAAWDAERNGGRMPRDEFMNCNKKRWFMCPDRSCAHPFDVSLNHIMKGKWCPYCSNKRLCKKEECQPCLAKSFASFPNKTKLAAWDVARNGGCRPRDVFMNSHCPRWFRCPDASCGHSFTTFLYDMGTGAWCPYCAGKRFCGNETCVPCRARSIASDVRAARLYAPRNADAAWNVSLHSHKYVWWVCNQKECRKEWRAIPNSVYGQSTGCPFCVQSISEREVRERLTSERIAFEWQWKQEWCRRIHLLSFDFYVPSAWFAACPFVLEVDGLQHFFPVRPSSFDKQRERDLHKMRCLMQQEIPVVRILSSTVREDRNWWLQLLEACKDLRSCAIVLQDHPLYRRWFAEQLRPDSRLGPFVTWVAYQEEPTGYP